MQDGIAIAATLLSSAESRGKKVSAGNVSYFATRLVRQGRRSTGQSKTDVMHPGTQIAGRCRVTSLDEPLAGEAESDDIMCLHDVLAARSADPSQKAGRTVNGEVYITKEEVAKRLMKTARTVERWQRRGYSRL